ncbi:branched-chain amino acid:cation transporter, LIVCS family [Arenibacter nanhaiticus]|uniref:Branched-chain amino acid:cation transporter, LIVCS family n=1 Tax=Arenibacter nanhaiticus TaxID=558155 RepID=A0A1M6A9G8_9FLAO|nr:branched-chain amino acid transport system II carrier protein [Arenibacter nanhaiticus]SHI33066.1 branched-chain amino acid:cation transporter, LIVCS family [Arenibacter nanhaiticus]
MLKSKETLVTTFALFSLFFGAGNLILPPFLGFQSGHTWWLVAIGFCLSAVLVPILGILAHAKLQGTIYDFGKKVSPGFSLVYSLLIYGIAIALPSPRTASVTHEIAIQPYFTTSSLLTSILYFSLVFLFAINRSKILDILGKILTPAIIIILLLIIGITLFGLDFSFGNASFPSPLSAGILEGYQTFDAIAAIVVGGVIIISINQKNNHASYHDKKKLIATAGWLAGLALFLIYTGLIFSGSVLHHHFDDDATRTELLKGISQISLGSTANLLLSLLVSLACFTTAVGIVTGTSDFIKDRFQNSQKAYIITAMAGCLLGIVIGQFNVAYIIRIALPALMFIYPITIVLILLNVVPEKYGSSLVFRTVVLVCILFSIPDFLASIGVPMATEGNAVLSLIPFSEYSLGWVLPALISFVAANYFHSRRTNTH